MRRLAILVALAVAGVGLAQVPVTRWHTDPLVALPSGAYRLPEADCTALTEPLGYHKRPGRACYIWLEDLSTYELLVMNFELAGYGIANESLIPQGRGTMTFFFREDRPMLEGVFTLYASDGSVVVLAFQEPDPE